MSENERMLYLIMDFKILIRVLSTRITLLHNERIWWFESQCPTQICALVIVDEGLDPLFTEVANTGVSGQWSVERNEKDSMPHPSLVWVIRSKRISPSLLRTRQGVPWKMQSGVISWVMESSKYAPCKSATTSVPLLYPNTKWAKAEIVALRRSLRCERWTKVPLNLITVVGRLRSTNHVKPSSVSVIWATPEAVDGRSTSMARNASANAISNKHYFGNDRGQSLTHLCRHWHLRGIYRDDRNHSGTTFRLRA